MKIAVVGGGAAGFFSAITVASQMADAQVTILEATNQVLAKVKVSGGGRCNVTNGLANELGLVNCYPRGKNSLKKVFVQFSFGDTVRWFQEHGVKLKQEEDGRLFPVSDSSQTIVSCLENTADLHGVKITRNFRVKSLQKSKGGFLISDGKESFFFDRVIITSGGYNKIRNYDWLTNLGIEIESPVPSLFTFRIKDSSLVKLMGVSQSNVVLKARGTKLVSKGSLLITHWGLSGPAVLKLSAFGARIFNEENYDFNLQVNWINENEDTARKLLNEGIHTNKSRKIVNKNPFRMASSLWEFLLKKSGINKEGKWSEVGKKDKNRLVNVLVNDEYQVLGKSTFKEEFVTCGGVKESNVNFATMESKTIKGLFFAGEVLNIDGITGGFNFQAAWSTGYVAGLNICK